jgi:hypothetical protein
MTSLDAIRRRFGDRRPGLQLIGIVEAAIPVTMIRADVLAQERKPLSLLEEFILRFVHAGVKDLDELAGLLGLQRDQVVSGAAEQIGANNLTRSAGGGLGLTSLGIDAARDLAAVQPVLSQLRVPFDRITWSLEDYSRSSLVTKKDALENGLALLPAKKSARVVLSDLPVERFNELMESRDDRSRQVEVLRVRKIAAQNHHLYLPAQLLVYGDAGVGEVELGLCVDGDLRAEHGLELAAGDAVTRLGISVSDPEPRPTLSPELEQQRVPSEEIEIIKLAPPAPHGATEQEMPLQRLGDILVRSVSVFEHAELLAEAIDSSKRRLLIISPWIKAAVVNTAFIAAIERRLRAGVDVYVGHGIGSDDRGSDAHALRRLTNLAARFESKFKLVRLKNTHAKILIFDDVWINTSFNWLSFKGDPNRTFRMEEGTLVRIPSEVDTAFAQYVSVIRNEGADPRVPAKQRDE